MKNIDEDFLEEMSTDISNHHIDNGCNKPMADLLALLNVYKVRDLHIKRNIKKSIKIRNEIFNVVKKYRSYRREVIHALYRELECQILLIEDERKEKHEISLKILIENGEIVYHIDCFNIRLD